MQKILTLDFDGVCFKVFDWSTSSLSLGYGLFFNDPLWVVAGAAGIVASWYRPIGRFQRFMNSMVARRI